MDPRQNGPYESATHLRHTPAVSQRRCRQRSSGPLNARCSGNAPRRPLPTICVGKRTAGVRRRLRRHLGPRVPTASACLGPKARKHDNPFGRLTNGQNDGKGFRKSGCFFVPSHVLAMFRFHDLGNRRFCGETTNHMFGLQLVSATILRSDVASRGSFQPDHEFIDGHPLDSNL